MNKVDQAFDFWIKQAPASGHTLDRQRFFEIILAATKDNVDSDWFKQKMDTSAQALSKNFKEKMTKEFELLLEFAKYVDRK